MSSTKMSKNIVEVINVSPQIKKITLSEKPEYYILDIHYESTYSTCRQLATGAFDDEESDKYLYILVGKANLQDKIYRTEIQLRFPDHDSISHIMVDRYQGVETYIFFRKSIYENTKEVITIKY